MPLLINLDKSYKKIQKDKKFKKELNDLFKNYVGRPSSLHFAKNLSKYINGPKVYFKRDELNHTGAHKINNCLGQILLAKKMGKTRIIAETGAGQHGVATATVCALFGLPCYVYMGSKDIERQKRLDEEQKLREAARKLKYEEEKYNIENIIEHCNQYAKENGEKIFIEYVLLKDVNDTEQCAKELSKIMSQFPCKLNLIQFFGCILILIGIYIARAKNK